MGRIIRRFAFVRRKRWKTEMTMPDEKSDASAKRAPLRAASKSCCKDCTSTGMIKTLDLLAWRFSFNKG